MGQHKLTAWALRLMVLSGSWLYHLLAGWPWVLLTLYNCATLVIKSEDSWCLSQRNFVNTESAHKKNWLGPWQLSRSWGWLPIQSGHSLGLHSATPAHGAATSYKCCPLHCPLPCLCSWHMSCLRSLSHIICPNPTLIPASVYSRPARSFPSLQMQRLTPLPVLPPMTFGLFLHDHMRRLLRLNIKPGWPICHLH